MSRKQRSLAPAFLFFVPFVTTPSAVHPTAPRSQRVCWPQMVTRVRVAYPCPGLGTGAQSKTTTAGLPWQDAPAPPSPQRTWYLQGNHQLSRSLRRGRRLPTSVVATPKPYRHRSFWTSPKRAAHWSLQPRSGPQLHGQLGDQHYQHRFGWTFRLR